MPFVTGFERRGILKALDNALRTRFGEEGGQLTPVVAELDDAEKYLALHEAIITAATLDEVRQAIVKAQTPPRGRKRNSNGKRASSKK
jgi:hypothetical protein